MRRRARIAIIVSIGAAAGCGGFLGFGSDDEEPTPQAAEDAASADGPSSSEGGSNIVVDASGGTDATAADVVTDDVITKADAMTLGDGRVCVPSGVCTVSVFDCCTEMEDVSASSCEGLCGVDICCF